MIYFCNELLVISHFDPLLSSEVFLCCFVSANCCSAVLNHCYAGFLEQQNE